MWSNVKVKDICRNYWISAWNKGNVARSSFVKLSEKVDFIAELKLWQFRKTYGKAFGPIPGKGCPNCDRSWSRWLAEDKTAKIVKRWILNLKRFLSKRSTSGTGGSIRAQRLSNKLRGSVTTTSGRQTTFHHRWPRRLGQLPGECTYLLTKIQ